MNKLSALALSISLISACSSEKNLPNPTDNIPEKVKALVYQSHPGSEISDVAVLEKGKIYQLGFRHNENEYYSIVNNTQILSTTREADEQIPEQLIKRLNMLSIKGGKLSNYRIVQTMHEGYNDDPDWAEEERVFDYQLNGVKYTLRYYDFPYSNRPMQIVLRRYEKGSYITRTIDDLPEKIREFLNARHRPNPAFVNSLTNLSEESRQKLINNNEITYSGCTVFIMADGTKIYAVGVNFMGVRNLSKNSMQLIFNNEGELVWVPSFNRIRLFGQNFDEGPQLWNSNLSLPEINYFRDLFAGQSQLLGFNLDVSGNFNESFRNGYENTTSYEFKLLNKDLDTWILQYNAKKELVHFFYFSSPY